MPPPAEHPATGPGEPAPLHLVFMCTANQCRSPLAEVIARHLLADRGVPAEVGSAGVLPGGVGAARGAVRAAAAAGLDLEDHVSRTISSEVLGPADLIVTMERQHLVEVAGVDLTLVDRAFTLRELDRVAGLVGPRRPGERIGDYVARVAGARDPGTVLNHGTGDDLPDPMGGSRRAFRATATEITEVLSRVVWLLYPSWSTAPAS